MARSRINLRDSDDAAVALDVDLRIGMEAEITIVPGRLRVASKVVSKSNNGLTLLFARLAHSPGSSLVARSRTATYSAVWRCCELVSNMKVNENNSGVLTWRMTSRASRILALSCLLTLTLTLVVHRDVDRSVSVNFSSWTGVDY
jgi:hypothetical protein